MGWMPGKEEEHKSGEGKEKTKGEETKEKRREKDNKRDQRQIAENESAMDFWSPPDSIGICMKGLRKRAFLIVFIDLNGSRNAPKMSQNGIRNRAILIVFIDFCGSKKAHEIDKHDKQSLRNGSRSGPKCPKHASDTC